MYNGATVKPGKWSAVLYMRTLDVIADMRRHGTTVCLTRTVILIKTMALGTTAGYGATWQPLRTSGGEQGVNQLSRRTRPCRQRSLDDGHCEASNHSVLANLKPQRHHSAQGLPTVARSTLRYRL